MTHTLTEVEPTRGAGGKGVGATVTTFLVLVWAISAVFDSLIIRSGRVGGGRGVFSLGLMWSPAAAALLTAAIHRRPIATFGWVWGRTRYQLLSYVIPLAYASIAYGFVWATGLGSVGNPAAVAAIAREYSWATWPAWVVATGYVVLQATVSIIPACASALGEEIGWRGFLVPELSRALSFTKVSIFSGVIWATWHYPILLFADYNAGTPAWYGLTCFTVMVVGMSFILAWMRLRSGSLWTGMLLHGSHNLFVQTVFNPFTTNTGRTRYFTGEFGAALAVVAVVAAVIAWRARGAVEGNGTGD